jgi:hypothetical protein
VFTNDTDSNVTGSLPRVNYTRSDQKLGPLPLYAGASTEFASLIRKDIVDDLVNDRGLTRIDFYPRIRFPFTKLPYLSFNSALGFRETYWSESLGPRGGQVSDGIFRRYFTLGTSITGPVFTRIFNTPGSTYAQKFKHVIEPTFAIERTTMFDDSKIVKLEGVDQTPPGVTSITYGLNNRLYAKKQSAREIMTVSLSQTYYSDAKASQVDPNYQNSFNANIPPSNFSPIALQVHVSPTTVTDATMRMEYDEHVHALRSIAANGGMSHGWVYASAQWSILKSTPTTVGQEAVTTSHFLNALTTVRIPGNAWSGTYAFNYDIRNTAFINQRYIGHYNTQCCGIAFEYQKFNYGTRAGTVGVPKDHRFNLSFTLAGIGTFSDLFGAFGGLQGSSR